MNQFNVDSIDKDMIYSEPFWLNNPIVLFKNLDFIPRKNMTQAQRLNALTRLLILICLLMYYYDIDGYQTVFFVGLLFILLLRHNELCEHFAPHRGQFNPCRKCGSCGFDSQLPYIDQKYEVSPHNQYTYLNDGLNSYSHAKYTVIPSYVPDPMRQTWRNESKWCNEYHSNPASYTMINSQLSNYPESKCYFDDNLYVDNTPSHPTFTKKPGLHARQGAFERHSNEFRNNIMGEYVDFFYRQRNHSCVNFKPGRKTTG